MNGGWVFFSFLIALTVSGSTIARPSEPEEEVHHVEERQGTDGSGEGDEGFWASRRPCSCGGGKCGCCTGTVFPLPAFIRQRACMNLTYLEDEFALKMAISLNNRVLYNNKVSGRNPRPICVSPPRLPRAQLCVKFHDVFLIERNIHACMNVEGLFNKNVLFGGTLGCMRVGANGFAIVRPEDGGGLPSIEPADPDDEDNDDYDYDEVDEENDQPAQNQPLQTQTVQNKPPQTLTAQTQTAQNQPSPTQTAQTESEQNQTSEDKPEDNDVDTEGGGDGEPVVEEAGRSERKEWRKEDKIVGVGTVEEVRF